MAQAKQIAQFNTFVAGFITEATELTFPENSSYEEENCVLLPKGNRKRRLGIDYETSYSLSSYSATDTELETFAIHTYTWTAVGGEGGLNFLLVQLGNVLRFYDLSNEPLSGGLKAFTVDLDSYLAPAATTSSEDRVSAVAGRGDLFVTSPTVKPLQIVYDHDTDTVSVNEINIKIRDFDGLDDSLEVDEEPSTLSTEHEYNLLNQGWYATPSGHNPLTTYFSSSSVYPPNSLQWFIAKDDSGNIDVASLRKLSIGTSSAARGHYILDPFFKDRSAASGVAGIAVESVDERPGSVAFYAGRVAYGTGSEIYLSQVLNLDRGNSGKCYQEADPTSEDISDLVDSDGVAITIPEAGSILALETVGENLMVFANNGVWFIAGSGGGGFKATDFVISKVTSLGVLGRHSVINVEGITVWLSETSIMSLQLDQVTGRPSAISLTDDRIKTFYTEIPSINKQNAIGQYDVATKTVQWLYKDDDTAPANSSPYFYNKALTLDLRIGAFYKYSISSVDGGETPFIGSIFRTPSLNHTEQVFNVIDDNGDQVVDDNVDNVVADIPVTVGISTFTKYLAVVPNTGSTVNNITFALFSNLSFTDWETYDIIEYSGIGADYVSFLETGFDLQNDMVRYKQAPYIITHCKRTEDSFILDNGNTIFVNPSSLFMQARWDWSDHGNSGKWSTNQQVYRERRMYIPNESTLEYDPGNLLVTAKSKVRGRGRALQLRFESEQGKDFDILGWGIVYTGNTDV